jgi:hypothetical protein
MAMSDTSPAETVAAVAPSDTGSVRARALYVGGGGDVTVDTANSSNVTFKSVPTGTVLAVRATRVYATNTTATNIVAMF